MIPMVFVMLNGVKNLSHVSGAKEQILRDAQDDNTCPVMLNVPVILNGVRNLYLLGIATYHNTFIWNIIIGHI